MGRSWTWCACAMLCFACGGSPAPRPKATVEVARAAPSAPVERARPKREASESLQRHWVMGVRPQVAVYADLQGLVRTELFLSLLNGFLTSPQLTLTPAQHDCIRDALSSVRELAIGVDGGFTLTTVRFDPSAMRKSPAICLSTVASLTPVSVHPGVETYEVSDREFLAIRDGILVYGWKGAVTHALEPDRVEVPWPSGLELSADQYLAFTLSNPTIDGSPYTQLFSDGSGGLFLTSKHLRLQTSVDMFDEGHATEFENELRGILGSEREGITLERAERRLTGAIELSGTAVEQGAQVGLVGGLVSHGVRKYLRNANQTEARFTIAEIADSYAVTWRHAPVASKRKLWSLPAVPKAIPRGTRDRTSPHDWIPWAKIGYGVSEAQCYQYEVVATADGLSAEIIARGDLDGDGAASKFSLRLELRAGEITILPEIAETDPGE